MRYFKNHVEDKQWIEVHTLIKEKEASKTHFFLTKTQCYLLPFIHCAVKWKWFRWIWTAIMEPCGTLWWGSTTAAVSPLRWRKNYPPWLPEGMMVLTHILTYSLLTFLCPILQKGGVTEVFYGSLCFLVWKCGSSFLNKQLVKGTLTIHQFVPNCATFW